MWLGRICHAGGRECKGGGGRDWVYGLGLSEFLLNGILVTGCFFFKLSLLTNRCIS